MRILWIVNIMLPDFALSMGLPFSNREGWLSDLADRFKYGDDDIYIAFPTTDRSLLFKQIKSGKIEYLAFYEDLSHPERYIPELEGVFKKMISEIKPDVLHVSGSEFPHALAAVAAFNNPERTVISMQGICRRIAGDYTAMLPEKVVNSFSLRDILRRDSIRSQRRKFYLRAVNETRALGITHNVIGRTSFDKEAVLEINEELRYFCVNETMRKSFYEGKWDINNMHPHTIFVGQGDYPIKGMHFLIKACGELIADYPDLRIVIAGNSIINARTLKERIKLPAYGIYLRRLIKENNLEGHIETTGMLNEEQMKERYLSSSVFVLPSYVENSPNTLAEAMLLGVPVVTSDAGGVKDMINPDEGYIFKRGDHAGMARLIAKVWEDEGKKPESIIQTTQRCIEHARAEFDADQNFKALLNVYKEIVNEA